MSLRLRLCLMVTGLILVAAAIGFVLSLVAARQHVRSELLSVADYVTDLAQVLESQVSQENSAEQDRQLFQNLARMNQVPHLSVRVDAPLEDFPLLNEQREDGGIAAPGWFVRLMTPQTNPLLHSFALSNGTSVMIYINSASEIETAWAEIRQVLLFRFFMILVINLVLFYYISRWLEPANDIATVLSELEAGNFSRKVPSAKLPELQMIGHGINRFGEVMGASKAENDRLARKALSIQEQERRYMARELHDSLGQSISAIKAIAVSIHQRIQVPEPGVAESARNIEEIADKAYTSVRDMMNDLRPFELDELGLEPALEQMVDDWNEHHEDTFCRFYIDGSFNDLDELQQINVYRVVQEALTNVAKYAAATFVDIKLSGKEVISLSIIDDGKGFDQKFMQSGMGMQNLKERVQALQGELSVRSSPMQGVAIQIEFPRQVRNRRRASDRV